MGGLIFILPIFALDLWLFCTTGRRQLHEWREQKKWRHILIATVIGISLGIWLACYLQYGHDSETRRGFPIPLLFFHPEDKSWSRTALPSAVFYASAAVDFLTGLAAPMIPYKIGEFIKQVKAELK